MLKDPKQTLKIMAPLRTCRLSCFADVCHPKVPLYIKKDNKYLQVHLTSDLF